MKYYQHHIGDFDKKTRHLSRLERSIYRDLMDLYYDSEHPLETDARVLCRKVLARSSEEVRAVDLILGEFFTLEDDGWHNRRCDEEIQSFQIRANIARTNGKTGGRPSGNPAGTQRVNSGNPELTQAKATHEPVTINQLEKDNLTVVPKEVSKRKMGTRLSKDFEPDATCWQLSEKLLLTTQDYQQALEEFTDYWTGVPGQRGRKLDWQATFRNQLRHVKGKLHHGKATGYNGHKPGSLAEGFAKLDAVLDERERRENAVDHADGGENVIVLSRLRESPA